MTDYPRMYDSTTPDEIPAGSIVAAYVNGSYAWTPEQLSRFPKCIRISVTQDPAAAALARAIDVENGDADPTHAREFVKNRIALGHTDATVYCNRGNLDAVRAACKGLPYRVWLATLDGTMFGPGDGYWAVQYAGADRSGGHYDISVVYGKQDFSVVG